MNANGCIKLCIRENYGSRKALEAEWGATGRVRWLLSSVGKATSESPVQYHNFIVGRNGYGATEIENGSAKTIIKEFGSGGTADPLNQRSTAGWKTSASTRLSMRSPKMGRRARSFTTATSATITAGPTKRRWMQGSPSRDSPAPAGPGRPPAG